MDASSSASAPGTSRWLRILMIVVVGCVVGPLIAGSVLWVSLTASEVVVGNATPVAEWPAVWAGMMLIGYLVGVPYAALTSGIFALLAVLAGLRQLLTALIIAIIPASLYFIAATSVTPDWKNVASFWGVGFLMIGMATTACWYLTRRWHSPNP